MKSVHTPNRISTMKGLFWRGLSTSSKTHATNNIHEVKKNHNRASLNRAFSFRMEPITSTKQMATQDVVRHPVRKQILACNQVGTLTGGKEQCSVIVSRPEELCDLFESGRHFKNFPASAFLRRLPKHYYDASPSDLIRLVADMVLDLIGRQARHSTIVRRELSRFHSKGVPQISVLEYLERLQRYIRLSSPAILTVLLYIRRLCRIQTSIWLSHLTIHRILLSCAAISAKIMTDHLCWNKIHARAGGVRPEELTVLEFELLQILGWNVTPRDDELAECYLELVDRNGGYLLLMSGPEA
jgi:hypothetical protein